MFEVRFHAFSHSDKWKKKLQTLNINSGLVNTNYPKNMTYGNSDKHPCHVCNIRTKIPPIK